MNHILPEPTKEQIAELALNYRHEYERAVLEKHAQKEADKNFRAEARKDLEGFFSYNKDVLTPEYIIYIRRQLRNKARKLANRDKRLEYCRQYYQANKQKLSEYGKEYRKNNKPKLRALALHRYYRMKLRKAELQG